MVTAVLKKLNQSHTVLAECASDSMYLSVCVQGATIKIKYLFHH